MRVTIIRSNACIILQNMDAASNRLTADNSKLMDNDEDMSESDSDSSIDSSDDEGPPPSCKGLEWDNSTLTM